MPQLKPQKHVLLPDIPLYVQSNRSIERVGPIFKIYYRAPWTCLWKTITLHLLSNHTGSHAAVVFDRWLHVCVASGTHVHSSPVPVFYDTEKYTYQKIGLCISTGATYHIYPFLDDDFDCWIGPLDLFNFGIFTKFRNPCIRSLHKGGKV